MLVIELNDIVEALQELNKQVYIMHYDELIAVIDEKTNIKPFKIKKKLENGLIILDFNGI